MTPLTQPRARILLVFILLLAVSTCLAQSSNEFYGQRLEEISSQFADSNDPAKAVLLNRMESLREYVNDADSVANAIDRIANDHNESMLVRDEANWRRSRIAVHERRLADAAPIIEALGFVRDWTLLGSQACKVKRQIAPTALKASPLATVSVYGKPVTVCAASAVFSASSKNVALRFGANGLVSLYVNGTMLRSANAQSLAFDQHSVGVQLQAGWNTIALELAGKNANKQFTMRITGTDGGGVTLAADSSHVSAEVAPASKVSVVDLLATAQRQAQKSSRRNHLIPWLHLRASVASVMTSTLGSPRRAFCRLLIAGSPLPKRVRRRPARFRPSNER
jgi:hypothetical protein